MAGRICVERSGDLGFLIVDQPGRRNAVSVEMWRQIPNAVAELAADDAVRVVVLRGRGEVAFVAGADISEFHETRSGGSSEQYDRDNQQAFEALAGLDKPLLAMIHGFCVGGGVALALTADMRYAAQDAVFAIPAARLGLGYAFAGVETLARLVGDSRAKEILFTAKRFSAAEALQMGLVNAVVPKAELEAEVVALAEQIAQNAPLTVRSAKVAVRELSRLPAERDLARVAASIESCYASDDYAEGVRAFLEKRPPAFKGR